MIDPKTVDIYDEAFLTGVEDHLVGASVASCNCGTKSNDIAYHSPHCPYRALMEGYAVIRAFRDDREEREMDAKGDNLDRGL